ncbi:uncharacterized protein TNCV_3901991 [Trichonephila clavipes]|nr:uncharacterized protein TNCV_3901991 [Trichonephila clavipes]
MTSCNHMRCHSCNGSKEPFFNRTMLASHGMGVTKLSPHCYYLPWRVRSPDLSPIKNIWDHLERRVVHPTSMNELEARLEQISKEMSQGIIQNLYASLPDSIASCIRARGGSTGY